jgi:hypothetical protein
MKVKIFSANGLAKIEQLEGEINGWLDSFGGSITVTHTSTALCTVANSKDDEHYQSAVITIWYE